METEALSLVGSGLQRQWFYWLMLFDLTEIESLITATCLLRLYEAPAYLGAQPQTPLLGPLLT